MLEEYGPRVRHLPGHLNLVADALSRLDIEEDDYDDLPTDIDSKPLFYEEEKRELMFAKAERLDALLLFPLASERALEGDMFRDLWRALWRAR